MAQFHAPDIELELTGLCYDCREERVPRPGAYHCLSCGPNQPTGRSKPRPSPATTAE